MMRPSLSVGPHPVHSTSSKGVHSISSRSNACHWHLSRPAPSWTCQAGESPPSTSEADPAKAALLARIAKAKQYKQGGSATASPAPTAAPPPPPPPQPGVPPAPVDWGAVASFLDSGGRDTAAETAVASQPLTPEQLQAEAEAERERMARFEAAKDKMSDEYSPIDTDNTKFTAMIMNARQTPGKGSALQPASFLSSVLSDDSDADDLDASTMRMEEFTAAKEARQRQLGAEILTVDPTYRAGGDDGSGGNIVSTARNANAAELFSRPRGSGSASPEPATQPAQDGAAVAGGEEGEVYKPKVTTWGVFPRPKDISKEYGGGRDIKPGQELETPDQKATREAAYAAAMQSYRAQVGLEVDVEAEQQAQVLYDEGMVLFAAQNLRGSYDKFQQAMKLVPLKSKVGGLAGLQAAIILDSQGVSEEAQKLYKKLQGHAVSSVARKAKQMLFGFKAAEFLRTDTISYAAKKGDFDRYFRGIADRNKVWVPTEEERLADEAAARTASLIAVAVLVGPVAVLGTLITKYGHQIGM